MPKLTVLAALVLPLAGCTGFQPIEKTQVQIAHVDITTPAIIAQYNDEWPEKTWWAAYGDRN